MRSQCPLFKGFWVFSVLISSCFYPGRLQAEEFPTIQGVETTCSSTASCLRLLRLEGEDFSVRLNAVVTLGALRDPLAVPDLIEIVRNHAYRDRVYHYEDTPHSLLVVTALRALGTIGDRQSIPVLIQFIQKEAYIQFRVLAADMIRMIGIEPEDVPMLLPLLNDPHTSIRFVIFETIRFADDPVSKRYTRRFVNYVPRADMIEDSVTTSADAYSIGVSIYPGSEYLFYASASDEWIMRKWPARLDDLRWLHTFFTMDSVGEVLSYYERLFDKNAKRLSDGARRFNFGDAEDVGNEFIGEAFGFILRKTEEPSLRASILLVSIYEDKVLEGTAISFYAPK